MNGSSCEHLCRQGMICKHAMMHCFKAVCKLLMCLACTGASQTNLLSDGIYMRTQFAKGNIPVLSHHTRPIQVSQALVRVGLQGKSWLWSD